MQKRLGLGARFVGDVGHSGPGLDGQHCELAAPQGRHWWSAMLQSKPALQLLLGWQHGSALPPQTGGEYLQVPPLHASGRSMLLLSQSLGAARGQQDSFSCPQWPQMPDWQEWFGWEQLADGAAQQSWLASPQDSQ